MLICLNAEGVAYMPFFGLELVRVSRMRRQS